MTTSFFHSFLCWWYFLPKVTQSHFWRHLFRRFEEKCSFHKCLQKSFRGGSPRQVVGVSPPAVRWAMVLNRRNVRHAGTLAGLLGSPVEAQVDRSGGVVETLDDIEV